LCTITRAILLALLDVSQLALSANSDTRRASLLSLHMVELAQLAFFLMLWGIVDTMFCALRR
jgi:hypothetical protein